MISEGERPQTYTLDREDTGTGSSVYCCVKSRGDLLPRLITSKLHAAELSGEECRLSPLPIDWDSFPGLKLARREADRLISSSSETKNQWR